MPKLDLAKQARRTWDGANLQLSLNSKALSPSLRLTISCYRNKKHPAATAFVDFYFVEIHCRDPSAVDGKYNNVRGVINVTYAFSDDGKSCDIAWTSYACVPTNLPFVSTRNNFKVRPSETKLIDELLGHANPDDSGALIQLRVPLSDEEQTARNTGAIDDFKLGSLLLSLPGARIVGKTQLRPNIHAEEQPSAKPSDAMSSDLLDPCKRSSGHPRVQASNKIPPKLLIKQDHPF
ncbi:hypothetical protein CKM354_000216600 [Cercospora kikuchii]|uniref:Uncharacterized protein n=1 Tax=Cercospora kikuchii TaxID=84275 RepID=A0A9P3FCI6_9PEZI|nr:uncharacterized protein CKM354_000216600 [Cercospora kikuchii]GIZ38762.1 hypothetical protein CKM354_000216600 [Cercospora kikuchii]